MRIFSLLFLISAVHGYYLVFILISKGLHRNRANLFLASLLLIVSGYLLKDHLILEGQFSTYPHLMAAFVPFFYLLGPLYFFYIKTTLNGNPGLNKWSFIHLIPALICFLTILPFYMKSGAEKLALYDAPKPEDFRLESNRIFFYGSIFLSALWYTLQALSLIKTRQKTADGRTHRSLTTQLQWLKNYTKAFLFFLFCFLLAQLIFIFTDFHQYYVMLSTVLLFSILIHFVGYWAIKESRILSAQPASRSTAKLSADQTMKLKTEVIRILEQEEVYLKSDLSTKYFCERLQVNSQYFSRLINSEFDCSFTHLINSYRIEKSKRMIKDPNYSHLSLLGIAIESGFNTKNTFTRAFKRHTGMTPSEFKS